MIYNNGHEHENEVCGMTNFETHGMVTWLCIYIVRASFLLLYIQLKMCGRYFSFDDFLKS